MTNFERCRGWARTHPLAVDAILAAVALFCMVIGSFAEPYGEHGSTWNVHAPGNLSLTLMGAGAATLVFRRRAPWTVLAASCALSIVELVTSGPRAPVVMCAVIALYTVAATTNRPTTWRIGASETVDSQKTAGTLLALTNSMALVICCGVACCSALTAQM